MGFGVSGTGGVPGGAAALRPLPARGRVAIAIAAQDSVPAAPLSGEVLQMEVARCKEATAHRR